MNNRENNKINKAFVDKVECPENGQKFYWDLELKGFGLRLTSGGSKAYVVQSRVQGKQIRRTIGEHGVFTAEEARLKAKEILLQMNHGKDPKLQTLEQRLKNITLAEVFEDYKRIRTLKEKTTTLYNDIMRRCLPDWQNKPIVSLTRDMVEKRLQTIATANGPRGQGTAQAAQCYRLLRSISHFTQEQYEVDDKPILEINPTRNLSRDRVWTKNVRRQGIIERHQLATWFRAVMSLDNITVRDYLLLLILTGLRRNEGLMLAWSEVNLEGKYIRIGGNRTKNHKEHVLPLSDYLCEMLSQRAANKAGSPYVFPSPVDPVTYLKEPKRTLNKIRNNTGITFMLHDLRRTFATIADELRLSQYTLKKLVNHSVGSDVTGGYVIAEMERLREPMQAITEYILGEAGLKRPSPRPSALVTDTEFVDAEPDGEQLVFGQERLQSRLVVLRS